MTAPRPFAEVVEELQRRMRLVEERCYPRDVDLLRIAAVDALPALLARAAVFEAAVEVMAMLDKHGAAIVPHLLDTDENAGQRLRAAITTALAAENQPRAERGEENNG